MRHIDTDTHGHRETVIAALFPVCDDIGHGPDRHGFIDAVVVEVRWILIFLK